jgi:Ca2+-binding EF-hand superfamily protein
MEELGNYVQKMDINKDGYIDETDLESFLKGYQYMDNPDYVENTATSIRTRGFFAKSVKSFPNLYPTKSLSNEKADMVLRDMRQALYLKKYSFLEFFRILDINQDGFITIGEFCQAIDKFVKFSQPIKEGTNTFYFNFIFILFLNALSLIK